jgi:hypothetical protein
MIDDILNQAKNLVNGSGAQAAVTNSVVDAVEKAVQPVVKQGEEIANKAGISDEAVAGAVNTVEDQIKGHTGVDVDLNGDEVAAQ